MSGKWHLGLNPEHNPHRRGFDKSFALLPGGSNHYGWEPQLGEDSWKFFGGAKSLLYTENGEDISFNANVTADPQGFYSSDFYTNKLLQYLDEWGAQEKEKPFFAFLPFSAPHWPLQCSKESRDPYKGVYDDGPDALRLRRLAALKKAGIVDEHVVPHEAVAPPAILQWNDLNDYERQQSARAMETYAGMVDNMDVNIGKVIEHLKATGEFDNTFIIFMSDNGAEGAAYEAMPVMGPNLMDVINKYYDNSVENIGNYNSFVWYGPRWASASTAPSRMYKMWSTEGGIKVPLIVHYPAFSKQKQHGSLIRSFSTVMDVAATVLDLAGIPHPAVDGEKGIFREREVVPLRGKSWVPYMSSSDSDHDSLSAIHNDSGAMGWELFGRAAVRQGRWKLVHVPPMGGGRVDGKWQLYDLEKDPGENDDLSEAMPQKYDEMLARWEEYQRATGVVWGMPIRFGFDKKPAVSEPEAEGEDDKDDVISQTEGWMDVKKAGS